jgi:hypothetical protein
MELNIREFVMFMFIYIGLAPLRTLVYFLRIFFHCYISFYENLKISRIYDAVLGEKITWKN